MENRPIIKKEQVETVYDSRFIKVFDLQYEPGKHYFDATRRAKDNLAAHPQGIDQNLVAHVQIISQLL